MQIIRMLEKLECLVKIDESNDVVSDEASETGRNLGLPTR